MRFRARRLAAGVALLAVLVASLAQAGSVRFFGNGVNQIDRIKIRIDDPSTATEPARPADVGLDFTIEFWVKGSTADNNGSLRCGNGVYGWIDGNTIFDRDRHSQQRAFGIALSGQGRVAFGATATTGVATICGTRNVLDGSWHHVAVTRTQGGTMRLFVDGVQDASTTTGPTGDISYPDNGVPENRCGGPCDASDPFIVLGAEKHDATASAPSYSGLMDELRISSSIRYNGTFTPSSVPFVADVATAGLYHFDQATSGNCASGTVIVDSATGLSPGECFFGGSPAGPQWSSDTPFVANGPGVLQLQAAAFSGQEGPTPITITVTRTGGTDGAATVNYTTANGTALSGSDYTTATGVLTWNDGDGASKSFPIPLVDDSITETAEALTVTLSGATGASLGAPSAATVTITDDDNAGTLQLSAASYPASEEGAAPTITVRRVGGNDGAVAVNYATTGGTAIADADFTTTSGTLSWADQDSANKTFTVPITNDTELDSGETFAVAISGPTGGAVLGTPISATVTISDTDTAGTLQFSAPTLSIVEASGPAVVQVTRVGGNAGIASVRCATSPGTALAPSDYTTTSTVLSWASGDMTPKNCIVPITDDVLDEPTETFTAALSQPSGATIGAPSAATISIQDDDPTTGALQFQMNGFTASEGAGTAIITVARVGGSESAVSVEYMTTPTGSTATAGVDYVATSGLLTWENGDITSRDFLVTINQDAVVESDETVRLQLFNFVAAQPGNPTNTALTIVNDDFAPPGVLQLSSAIYNAGEAAGTATITVRRVGGTSGAASVQFQTSNGTAIAPADYASRSGTLNWASGDGADKTFTIPIVDDALFEGAETLNVQLSNAVGATIGAIGSATLTIADNDVAQPGTLQFAQAAVDVDEGAGTLNLVITRTGGTDGAVQVTVTTTNGTALVGSDFGFQNMTVSWAAGDSGTRSVAVQITNDTTEEAAETFTATLINPLGGATLGIPVAMTVTITGNDPPTSNNNSGGGGAIDWWMLLLGLLPAIRVARLRPV